VDAPVNALSRHVGVFAQEFENVDAGRGIVLPVGELG